MGRVFTGDPLSVILRFYPLSMVDKSLEFHTFDLIDWVFRRYFYVYRVQLRFNDQVCGRRLFFCEIRKFQDCIVIF